MDFPYENRMPHPSQTQQAYPQQQFGFPGPRDAGSGPNQQYGNAALPQYANATRGGVISSGQQQQFYTSAPYTDGITSTTSPQRAQRYTNNTTPPHNNTLQSQYNQMQHQMAAPVTSNPQSGAVLSPINKTAPQTPQSPTSHSQDQERVTLLLQINQILLQEIVTMQEQGKGGDVQTPTNAKPGEEKKEPGKEASKEYVEFMRRMQANLAYLANVAERSNRPPNQVMPYPPIMAAPSAPPSLVEMYTKLQTLFPTYRPQQSKSSASPMQTPQRATGLSNFAPGEGTG